jgi:hypothetical protein
MFQNVISEIMLCSHFNDNIYMRGDPNLCHTPSRVWLCGQHAFHFVSEESILRRWFLAVEITENTPGKVILRGKSFGDLHNLFTAWAFPSMPL